MAPLVLALAAGLLPACGGCSRATEGLWIGDAFLSGTELDRAVEELRHSFGQFGQDTLRWRLLDEGMGPAAILHSRFPEESRSARRQAERYAARLRDGENFDSLVQEQLALTPREPVPERPRPPHPHGLGARVAAAAATLEPGEWTGPVRTLDGWELLFLVKRFDEVRSRSSVVVRQLVVPVGDDAARREAKEAWATLPLSGSETYLRALPVEFRRGRIVEPPRS